MKTLIAALCIVLVATSALAVAPGKDAYLVSVGHAQGACTGGVCSQWRTAVWIHNPSTTTTANVTMYFLERNKENATPVQQSFSVAAGETKEYLDAVLSPLGVDGKYGGIRVTSDINVVVTGRIYDENVPSTKGGTGTSGQFFAGLPPSMAIGNGGTTDILGLRQDTGTACGTWRSNFGFQEVTGSSCTVQVQRIDANGTVLATKSYTIEGRAQRQYAITDIGGTLPPGPNQRIHATVTAGSGKVLMFGSRIDNCTGDPSTVEMSAAAAALAPSTGLFDGIVFSADGSYIDGGIETVITSSGLTGFAGLAGLPCGSDSYVVDYAATAATPIPLGPDGSFSVEATIPYSDGTSTVFTTVWTLAGTLAADGAIHGTLSSNTTGGAGNWVSCNAVVARNWRAGWTQNP
jgi:hypothetical protein